MSTSTSPFLDVNTWLALAYEYHPHHGIAMSWAKSVDASERFYLSRFSQLGLLRLLTTRSAMGTDVLTLSQAWETHDRLVKYWNAVLLEEPHGLETMFRAMTRKDEVSPQYLADAYFAAFAEGHRLNLVTFDKALGGRVKGSILLREK